jgi:hypothetical protein
MVAANRTIEAVARVLREHLTDEVIAKIMHDLTAVRGNKSFEETVRLLDLELRR